jgi:hypothetical protein
MAARCRRSWLAWPHGARPVPLPTMLADGPGLRSWLPGLPVGLAFSPVAWHGLTSCRPCWPSLPWPHGADDRGCLALLQFCGQPGRFPGQRPGRLGFPTVLAFSRGRRPGRSPVAAWCRRSWLAWPHGARPVPSADDRGRYRARPVTWPTVLAVSASRTVPTIVAASPGRLARWHAGQAGFLASRSPVSQAARCRRSFPVASRTAVDPGRLSYGRTVPTVLAVLPWPSLAVPRGRSPVASWCRPVWPSRLPDGQAGSLAVSPMAASPGRLSRGLTCGLPWPSRVLRSARPHDHQSET